VNLHEASEHICQGFASLPATMKVVVLLYNNNNISMISNFTESRGIFEVLTRCMSSCFDPTPTSDFTDNCKQFLDTIHPTVAALHTTEGVVCFLDNDSKSAAMISSLENMSVTFAIICEHMFRTISGNDMDHGFPTSQMIH
jgi:hypothetical protein